MASLPTGDPAGDPNFGMTPEYPTHPTVLGIGLGLGLGSQLGLGLGLGISVRVRYVCRV